METLQEFKNKLENASAALAQGAQTIVNLVNEATAVTSDGMEVANLVTARLLMDGLNARLAGANVQAFADAVNTVIRLSKAPIGAIDENQEPPPAEPGADENV